MIGCLFLLIIGVYLFPFSFFIWLELSIFEKLSTNYNFIRLSLNIE